MSSFDVSLSRFLQSFKYAFKGIFASFAKRQINIKIHVGIAIVTIVLAIILSINMMEWITIIACIGIVIAAEMMNTAIETLVDIVSPEWNEKAGRVKDIAAGAVLVLAIMALIIGIVIFLPKILALL
jgi:diacylglycerol kinase (ATP)